MDCQDYIRKMHSKLDHWNAEIDALEAKSTKIQEQARAEYHKHMETLRSKREDARRHMEALQQASENAWSDMKSGIELALDAVNEALDSAKARFK